jgi:hypothetical protein
MADLPEARKLCAALHQSSLLQVFLDILRTDFGAENIAIPVDANTFGRARHRHRLLVRDQSQYLGVFELAEPDAFFAAGVIAIGISIA